MSSLRSAADGIRKRVERLQGGLRRVMLKAVPPRYHVTLFRCYLKLIAPLYVGDQCSCPCCERSYREFVPYTIVRPSSVCPGCGSFARHRLLFLYLSKKTNLFSDQLRVLHFAPEYGLQQLLRSRPNLDYVSVDLNSPLAMDKMDIMDLRYADGAFDVILCSHVLEHVVDDRKAMAELYRVLKPGGWAIMMVPVDRQRESTLEDYCIVSAKQRELHFGQEDHVRMYGRDFAKRLETAGFHVSQDGYARELEPAVIKRYVLPADDIFYCLKPPVQSKTRELPITA